MRRLKLMLALLHICFDRNRHGGGLACYVKNDLSLTKRNYFPHDIGIIFIEIFLPKAKPIDRPLKQTF